MQATTPVVSVNYCSITVTIKYYTRGNADGCDELIQYHSQFPQMAE